MQDTKKDHAVMMERAQTHDDEPIKPIPQVDKIDYSGAHEKTDPREIALVRKLDKWIMPMLWSMYWLNYLVCSPSQVIVKITELLTLHRIVMLLHWHVSTIWRRTSTSAAHSIKPALAFSLSDICLVRFPVTCFSTEFAHHGTWESAWLCGPSSLPSLRCPRTLLVFSSLASS